MVFTLGDGSQLIADLEAMSNDIRDMLALHGLSQKIGDGASGFSKARDHRGALVEMTAIHDGLLTGQWNRKGGGSGTSDIVTALSNLTGRTIEEARDVVDGMDDEQMKALKADGRIKEELKRIAYERSKEAAKAAKANKFDLETLFND